MANRAGKAIKAKLRAAQKSKARADDSRPKRLKQSDDPSITELEDQKESGVRSDTEMSEVDDPNRLTGVALVKANKSIIVDNANASPGA